MPQNTVYPLENPLSFRNNILKERNGSDVERGDNKVMRREDQRVVLLADIILKGLWISQGRDQNVLLAATVGHFSGSCCIWL